MRLVVTTLDSMALEIHKEEKETQVLTIQSVKCTPIQVPLICSRSTGDSLWWWRWQGKHPEERRLYGSVTSKQNNNNSSNN